ncbi:hypothetical protein [Pontibacter fetidus]|uniref:Uncharacterized protein n=1 Tax=Pontibacter fetidus TaxID=2700082 RepID=A0A6B2H571_9BACT|nr:hypothetical protein [Pontibacter fetidus]NDK57621.1 hypothetical protein [Pontibacter fetidus]
MNASRTYMKGKSVFIVSLVVVSITILTVYLSGINYNRSLTTNLYLSLSVIAGALFLFMLYGLYTGVGLVNNFPEFRKFKRGDYLATTGSVPDIPNTDIGDDEGGIFVAILLWLGAALAFIVLLIVLEAMIWVSVFIILAILYWVFFRALKLVFSKAIVTKGNLAISAVYALGYTCLYTGWIFGIAYLVQVLG